MHVIKFVLLLLIINPLYAHDLWNVGYKYDRFITNGKICIIDTYENKPTHISIVPERLTVSSVNYDKQALTPEQKSVCDNLMKATITTVLKAVPAPNGSPPNTRKTKDITATAYTKIRVSDASLCEGGIIRKYQKNKNWHKVVGLNLTTLCGEY